ncbi:unnamed protein product, partial [Choristocarpus tenellus]
WCCLAQWCRSKTLLSFPNGKWCSISSFSLFCVCYENQPPQQGTRDITSLVPASFLFTVCLCSGYDHLVLRQGIVLREMSEFRQALRIEKQRTAKGILR